MKTKTVYYRDELGDEFSRAKIKARKIDESYRYVYDGAWKKATHFFWYRIVATPIAFLYLKIRFAHKIKNKKVLKGYRSYYLFGNHTQDIADAFIPSMITFPKSAYVIVHPCNVSMHLLGKVTPSMGALPLPDCTGAVHNFTSAIEKRYKENNPIVIYPEAHIWPYATFIRNFTDSSFCYPIKDSAPVFCFTNTYHKRFFGLGTRIVTYVDGPFFQNDPLSYKDKRKDLRDRVYNTMKSRAENNEITRVEYRKEQTS